MGQSGAFRQCLVEGDFVGVRRLFASLYPHLPAPATDEQAEVALHMARTQADSVPFDLRAWSHSWLCERGLPSQMPDELKPKAERLYPRVVSAVGVSMRSTNPERQPELDYIRGKIEVAIEDMFSGATPDPLAVSKTIKDIRLHEARKLRRRFFVHTGGV